MSASADPGASGASEFVTAEEAAREIGWIRWWERRAAAVLGGWARTSMDPAWIAAWFDLSAHCAWRAERWAEWAPRIAAFEPESLVVARSADLVDRFVALEHLEIPSASVTLDTERGLSWQKLAFVDHKGRLDRLATRVDEVANRPVLRGICLSLADLELDERRLDALIDRSGGTDDSGAL